MLAYNSNPREERMDNEKWSFDGEIIDTCNCEVICPCAMGLPATDGSCLGNVACWIRRAS